MWQSQLDPVYIQANPSNASAAASQDAAEDDDAEEETKTLPTAGNKASWY